MSTMVTPVAHRVVVTPACFVMSSKCMCPLFRYRRLDTMLPAKKMSGNPSLLMSPTATPAPLYVDVVLDVQLIVGGDGVREGDAGLILAQQLEERPVVPVGTAGQNEQRDAQRDGTHLARGC